jgi:asparaginyl-tRNA synthetase
MIEPEMAFADLQDNMDLAEALVKNLVVHVMEHCPRDLELFARFVYPDLMRNLEVIAKATYVQLPYTEAVELLQRSGKSSSFPSPMGWACRPNTSAT